MMRNVKQRGSAAIQINIQTIALFILLFWSYHYNSLDVYHISSPMVFLVVSCAMAIPFLMVARLCFTNVTVIAVWALIMAESLKNNWYMDHGEYSRMYAYFVALLFAYCLQFTNSWYPSMKFCFFFFSLEHLILSWIFYLLPSFYRSKIIPLYSASTQGMLRTWQKENILMGMASHYSISGIIFGMGTIIFFADWLCEPKKKSKLMMFLIFFVSLLLTQKRGPLVFAAFGIVVIYLLYKKIGIMTVLKMTVFAGVAIIGLLILSKVVPEVLVVIERFTVSEGDDLTNGREPLFDLAKKLFNENKLFGVGWGQYKKYYKMYIWNGVSSRTTLNAHNMYLQILAEKGIVGGTIMFSLFAYMFLFSAKVMKQYVAKAKEIDRTTLFLLMISIGIQCFFLAYGITGNPIHDPICFIPYYITLAIPISVKFNFKR